MGTGLAPISRASKALYPLREPTMNSFEHAKIAARPDCPICHGSGMYMYDHNHGTICWRCCKHDQGFWALTSHHEGYSSGYRWCCLAGCGLAFPFNPDTFRP